MKQKFNNQQQLKIYNSDTLKEQAKISQSLFYYSINRTEENNYMSQYIMSYDEALSKYDDYMSNRALEYECADLINRAIRKKDKRIKKWVLRQLSVFDNIYFVTITFNEYINDNYSIEEKKAIMKKYLDTLNCNYVYCLGLGDENNKEHFHVLTTEKPPKKELDFGYAHYYKIACRNKIENIFPIEYFSDKNFKVDFRTERQLLNNAGRFLCQITRYFSKNSYKASLILNKQQRIIFVENIKISVPLSSREDS